MKLLMKRFASLYLIVIILVSNICFVKAIEYDEFDNNEFSQTSYIEDSYTDNQVDPNSFQNGYRIDDYIIKINVNENNTLDISETITANFEAGADKHGIIRSIPIKNSIVRNDGSTSIVKAQISNITVDNNFKKSLSGNNISVKIGDADQYVSGPVTYNISYTYSLGKDPLKNIDEFYFNIIGDEWDTFINHVAFEITMPKEFDPAKLGFSSGKTGTTNSDIVHYTLEGNTITGETIQRLNDFEALTIRLELPEKYFKKAPFVFDVYTAATSLVPLSILLLLFLISYLCKQNKYPETIEFYPPDNLNCLELSFYKQGSVSDTDIIPLIIELAGKGYITIEEYYPPFLIKKYKSYKLIKNKDYDGNNVHEKKIMEGLFRTTTALQNKQRQQIAQYAGTSLIEFLKQKEINDSIIFSENHNGEYIITSDVVYADELSSSEFRRTVHSILQYFNIKKGNVPKIIKSKVPRLIGYLLMVIAILFVCIFPYGLANSEKSMAMAMIFCIIAFFADKLQLYKRPKIKIHFFKYILSFLCSIFLFTLPIDGAPCDSISNMNLSQIIGLVFISIMPFIVLKTLKKELWYQNKK